MSTCMVKAYKFIHMQVLIYKNVITSRAFNKRRKPLVVSNVTDKEQLLIVSEQLNLTTLGQVFPSTYTIVKESILVTTHK